MIFGSVWDSRTDYAFNVRFASSTRSRRRGQSRLFATGRAQLCFAIAGTIVAGALLWRVKEALPSHRHMFPTFLGPGTEQVSSLGRGIEVRSLLVEPDDGSRALVRELNRAQRSIFVECYILTSARIVHALERAAAEGVAVFVLLEHHPFGMGGQPERIANLLRAAGIAVRWSPSTFLLTHAKYMVIDDQEAVVATANLSRSAFTRNREFLVSVRGKAEVRQLSSLFRADWDRLPGILVDKSLVVSPINARSTFAALIRGAHTSLQVYSEEMVDVPSERLLDDAARRGVHVRLILPLGNTAAGAALARSGAAVRTLSSPYVHAKVVVVDRQLAFVGSENFSSQSLDRNREIGILIRGKAVTRILSVFERDWRRGTPAP
jgi:cardiolipin synthase